MFFHFFVLFRFDESLPKNAHLSIFVTVKSSLGDDILAPLALADDVGRVAGHWMLGLRM